MRHLLTIVLFSFLIPLATIAQSNDTTQNSTAKLVKAYKAEKALLTKAYASNSDQLKASIDSLNNQTPDSIVIIATGNKWYGADMYCWLGTALKNAAKLGLTTVQQDSILAEDRFVVKQSAVLTDSANLRNLYMIAVLKAQLTPTQLAKLVATTNSQAAFKMSLNVWQKAVKNNATGGIGKANALAYFKKYNLAILYIDGGWLYSDPADIVTALDSLYKQVPDSLMPILTTNRFYGADMSSLAVLAIKNDSMLNLRKTLVDTLLAKARWEAQQEKLANTHPDSLLFNRAGEDAAFLPTVLTDTQYNALLVLKELPNSQSAALNHWRELGKYNLTSILNKDSTISAATNYYLIRNVIADKNANNYIIKKNALSGIDAAIMPASLRLLNQTKKGGAKATAGVYTW